MAKKHHNLALAEEPETETASSTDTIGDTTPAEMSGTDDGETPDIITLDDDASLEVRPRPKVLKKDMWCLFEFTQQSTRVTKTKSYELTLRANPVKADGTVDKRAAARYRLTMPVKRAGSTDPKDMPGTIDQGYVLVRAIDGDTAPRRAVKNARGRYENPTDGTIFSNTSEAYKFNDGIMKGVVRRLVEWYSAKGSLLKKRVYALVGHEVGQDGSVWPQLIGYTLSATPPEQAEVEQAEFFQDETGTSDSPSAEVPF